MEKYDSTVDAKLHIKNIQRVMKPFIEELQKRSDHHDESKLTDPERTCYDTYIPLLKNTKYGTREYFEIKDKMEPYGLKHHQKVNRHHPEHFKNGCKDMNLIDMIEMLCDWYAASLRSDTSFEDGFKKNIERFHIDKDVEKLLWTTYLDYIKK